MKGRKNALVALAVAVAVAAALAGCSTLGRTLSQMAIGSESSGTSSGAAQTAPSASQPSAGGSQSTTQSSSSAGAMGMAGFSPMQIQFYAVYAMAAPFGGYKVGKSGYKPGEGTVWEFTDSGHNRSGTIVEHALLRLNPDKSQWWRLEVKSGKDSLLYEFLVSADDTIVKVRYKDPDSGKIMEFVPDQARETQSGGSSPMPPTSGETSGTGHGKVSSDQQTITVKAGTFRTEHAIYTDDQSNYRSEIWSSSSVPGGLVKYTTKNLRSGELSQGELIEIEHGVKTVLQSY